MRLPRNLLWFWEMVVRSGTKVMFNWFNTVPLKTLFFQLSIHLKNEHFRPYLTTTSSNYWFSVMKNTENHLKLFSAGFLKCPILSIVFAINMLVLGSKKNTSFPLSWKYSLATICYYLEFNHYSMIPFLWRLQKKHRLRIIWFPFPVSSVWTPSRTPRASFTFIFYNCL